MSLATTGKQNDRIVVLFFNHDPKFVHVIYVVFATG
jgi:hypothetical protein